MKLTKTKMNNVLENENLSELSEDQQYLMRDGQRYLLYDRSAEEVSNLVPLDKYNVFGNARELMEGDLESGLFPYLVIKKEDFESVRAHGLKPSSSVNQFIVQNNIWGMKKFVAENRKGVFFALNREMSRDFPNISPDDYVVVLKDAEGFDPKIDERKGVPYYMHMIGTMQPVSPDKLLFFRVSEINLDPEKTVEVPVDTKLVEQIRREIEEELEEKFDAEVVSWTERLESSVFQGLNLNAVSELTEEIDILKNKKKYREKVDRPYDTWEDEDFDKLKEVLKNNDETQSFIKACEELRRTVDWFNSLSESKRRWELEALEKEDEEDFDFVSDLYDNAYDIDGGLRYYLVAFRKMQRNAGKDEAYIKKFENALTRYYDFVILG